MIRRVLPVVLFLLFAAQTVFSQRNFYWDTPMPFSPGAGAFPQAASGKDFAFVAWQETENHFAPDTSQLQAGGDIYISAAIRPADSDEWIMRGHVAGPFPYAGTEPSIFTAMLDSNGRIFLCVAAAPSRTEVYYSSNRGENWSSYSVNTGSQMNARTAAALQNSADALVPKMFQAADGSYFLFIVRSITDSITLYYARSVNGRQWTAFERFVTEPGMPLNFLPYHLVFGGKDVMVFQSFITGSTYSSFQLFIKTSADGGRSWSTARQLTGFMDPYMNTTSAPDSFNNERAHLSVFKDEIFLVWERRYGAGSPSIYGVFLDRDFNISGKPERINTSLVFCNNPIGWSYGDELSVIWFDNRQGNNGVIRAVKTGAVWENREMSRPSETTVFPRPVRIGDDIYLFWQDIRNDESRIYILSKDTHIDPPSVQGLNFTTGKRIANDIARVSWNIPWDVSGIEGFSWSWSQDPQVEPSEERMSWADTNEQDCIAYSDGAWYFKVRALDNAGNWSAPSGVVFVRDRTPPPPVVFVEPRVDGNGFLLSNTVTLRWLESDADDIAGFSWSLDYLGPAGRGTAVPVSNLLKAAPGTAVQIMGRQTFTNYENCDNGLWRFIVYPIDDVGNVGEAKALYFKLNKYVPRTYITYVDAGQEFDGDLAITILGRGFSETGNVTRVYFSREDTDAYERVLYLQDGDFSVSGDREISARRVENLPAGNYYIYVEHPVRGMARSPHTITVGRSLTYKFGDFTRYWEASWLADFSRRMVFDVWTAVFALVMIFCVVLFAFTIRGTALILAESRAVRVETLALLHGVDMPRARKKKLQELQRKGAGLRLKLASFTVALVSLVVVMVAAPLYVMMSANQRATLMQSLWDRSSVLLESLASGVRTFLPANNILELGFLPDQSDAMREVRYVTITGYGAQGSLSSDYVWASNDPAILSKINTADFAPGISRLSEFAADRIPRVESDLNARARIEVDELAENVAELNREGQRLAGLTDDLSQRRMENIQTTSRALTARISSALNVISETIYSEPAFDINAGKIANTEYHFYKPVMFRQTGSDIYVRGWIILNVSSQSIVQEIQREQRGIFIIILTVALAAIALGGTLSFILATFIILPIKSLVSHVEMIRDTEDKTKLAGAFIKKKSSDEIGVLSETINEMTDGLVKAALASQDLSIGKEIQKKFIPLELDNTGNKLTTGSKETPLISFFGYYEGAKGVSGDYFDYRDLDGRYYAVIKCDVAGKGIPAGLIMVQVATMFINFFRNWTPNEKGMHIEDLVYEINFFIEELGFKGRFAAFTLCLFDSQTGVVRFCNAGDNIIHYYDASEQSMKTLTLPQTPAAGILPNFLVETKGGYKIQTLTLDHNDILLLYTDGIEEAKRKFRDSNFAEIACDYKGAPRDTPHANHVVGQDSEELGDDRVKAIINAVMRRQTYTLIKYHNPHGNIKYHFDFSSSQASIEDLIMALVSIEKVFRLWKTPAQPANKILVDKKIDTFLRKHFAEYDLYCSGTQEYAENPAYRYYTSMQEDEQYDDLTILGIKRK